MIKTSIGMMKLMIGERQTVRFKLDMARVHDADGTFGSQAESTCEPARDNSICLFVHIHLPVDHYYAWASRGNRMDGSNFVFKILSFRERMGIVNEQVGGVDTSDLSLCLLKQDVSSR